VRDAFAEPFRVGDETIVLSTSIGIVRFPQGAMAREGPLTYADAAMYADKRRAKGSLGVSQ
jgi:predicted signal transduction protein with EAL and GGDEF domain